MSEDSKDIFFFACSKEIETPAPAPNKDKAKTPKPTIAPGIKRIAPAKTSTPSFAKRLPIIAASVPIVAPETYPPETAETLTAFLRRVLTV